MREAGMERGFTQNVKIDVCRSDFLCARDAGFKELGIHERAACGFRRLVGIIRVACCSSAGAETAVQIANVRDFDVDAVHNQKIMDPHRFISRMTVA